ncbi:alpha/beta fold hydrolase [Anaerocolumna jejuensis]|uniref:alpha/beta fold hydrolase n=1 Tax=Anaerocolumna jejuensis TaxID=259063 RepID=UPI003F7BDA36
MPYCQVEDCNIFYEDMGIGETILFLHSGYSRGIIAFSGQIQPFFNQYRLLLPDFRGHGRTTAINRDWDTAVIADDMAGFIEKLDLGKVHLIGYSLGGGVALHLAAKHPELVKSIVTIGCGGVPDGTGSEDYEPEALLERNERAFIEKIRVQNMEATGGDWKHHMRQSIRDWRMYPCLTDKDFEQLKVPVFFIAGELDTYASRDRLLAMQNKCTKAEVWIVPGCGHRPHMPTENVKEVNERIKNFLESVKG